MIFTVVGFVLTLALSMMVIWVSIYLVTGLKSEDWTGLAGVGLVIMFISTMRFWVMLFDDSRMTQFILRLVGALISAVILYLYAHLRLGLDEQKPKLKIAAIFPGIKVLMAVYGLLK